MFKYLVKINFERIIISSYITPGGGPAITLTTWFKLVKRKMLESYTTMAFIAGIT